MLLGENFPCLIAIPVISAPSLFQAFLQHFFDNRNIVNNEYGHIVLKKPRFVFSDKKPDHKCLMGIKQGQVSACDFVEPMRRWPSSAKLSAVLSKSFWSDREE